MTTSTEPLTAHDVRLFADPLRLRIIELLAREELCTCHLVDETGAKQPTVSHHLRILRTAGIVDAEPVGAFTYYRLRPEPLVRLAGALGELAEHARERRDRRPACS
jgi:ArsR family transcriptional regulator, arsenate/arsenite/antimonite-responsive transcriptional repressor